MTTQLTRFIRSAYRQYSANAAFILTIVALGIMLIDMGTRGPVDEPNPVPFFRELSLELAFAFLIAALLIFTIQLFVNAALILAIIALGIMLIDIAMPEAMPELRTPPWIYFREFSLELAFASLILALLIFAIAPRPNPGSASRERRVFVVHGHDDAAREIIARFLEKIDFEVVILHEQANQGRTVIEKFEANTNVGYAVVLLTPDDVGGTSRETLRPRARQNVILELGYFIGRLGRKHVLALTNGELEFPSDILGVVTEIIDSQGAWKQRLAKELQEVGYKIDWKKAMQ